jgi:hypothetical protein
MGTLYQNKIFEPDVVTEYIIKMPRYQQRRRNKRKMKGKKKGHRYKAELKLYIFP